MQLMSPDLTLYGHPDSGHAFKVRFFLEHAQIEHDYVVIDIFSDRATRPPAFRDAARYGEVPLLVHDGRPHVQSGAILMHLAEHFGIGGHPGMGDHSAGSATASLAERRWREAREWLLWEANRIGNCLPQLRADRRFEGSGLEPAARDWLMARYEHDVTLMNDWLADGKSWFVEGDDPSIADFALSGYLMLTDEAEVDVPVHVTAWLDRLRALPAWRHPYDMMT